MQARIVSGPCGRRRHTANQAAGGELGPPNRLAFGGPSAVRQTQLELVAVQPAPNFFLNQRKIEKFRKRQVRPRQDSKGKNRQTNRQRDSQPRQGLPSFCPVVPSLVAIGFQQAASIQLCELSRCGLPLAFLAIVRNHFFPLLSQTLTPPRFCSPLPFPDTFFPFRYRLSGSLQETNNYRH